jgi:hypothetical protein
MAETDSGPDPATLGTRGDAQTSAAAALIELPSGKGLKPGEAGRHP